MILRTSRLLTVLMLALAPAMATADMIVGSWNLRQLGWDNGKDIEKLAHIMQSMDLIAIQELMSDDALGELVNQLETTTGEGWESMASHSLGKGERYREHYGFVWRESEVEYAQGAVVFLDHDDVFAREPYSAVFRDVESGLELALANLHVVYGDSVGDRVPEIEALADYWGWLEEVYPGTPRLIAGDFNLEPDHEAWGPLREAGAMPALERVATTLALETGVYRSLYDNFWYENNGLPVTDQGMIPFPSVFGMEHDVARSEVSDHAPVFIALDGAELNLNACPGASTSTVDVEQQDADCIDLNKSPESALEGLPHVGPVRADLIADSRPWDSVGQLTSINGLGHTRVADINDSGLLCPLGGNV
ncbi:endonuclease/exonuclease/phosphatase family protein [Vreelandella titanicae]|uniref:Endonuclease n=1 Tax=Vreelandella titanicae TaxID=664683 RepID=A0A558J146_9GAMM|nr:endonuclease/exonuclease/phosphatase family protein [Halomonas titanicae]TVU87323.1 endonuclease [Halomonas titanicae]